jgi:hypothetical protein
MIRKQIAIQIPTPTTLIRAYFSIATDRSCVPIKTAKAGIVSPPRTKSFDDKDEQDGLGSTQVALYHGRVFVDEQQGIAQRFEDIVGHEKQEAVEGQQGRLGSFPRTDVSEEPEQSVEQVIFCFRLILNHLRAPLLIVQVEILNDPDIGLGFYAHEYSGLFINHIISLALNRERDGWEVFDSSTR